jgi:hypothetical protein
VQNDLSIFCSKNPWDSFMQNPSGSVVHHESGSN